MHDTQASARAPEHPLHKWYVTEH